MIQLYFGLTLDDVFAQYGWDCNFVDHYDADIIIASLLSGYPVVCAGRRLNPGDGDKVGHAFLVDGYKRSRVKTLTTYIWVYDDPAHVGFQIDVPERIEVSYGSPYITHYKMNWGHGSEPSMWDNWCSLEGIWQYHNYPPYSYNRKMIYGFSIL